MDSDMRYLWAAYRFGMWREMLDAELTEIAFEQKIIELMGQVDLDWIVEVKAGDGVRPAGLILGKVLADGRRIEPHIDWFPWATPRNKFEGIAAFLREVSKKYKILVYVESENKAFWERLIQYRMLCRGCNIRDYYSRGENAMFYYTAGP